MRKLTLVLATVVAMVGMAFAGTAAADSPNSGCRDGWIVGLASSPDAVARDRNGDGNVCAKFVNGVGNGSYLVSNVVVTDNNNP